MDASVAQDAVDSPAAEAEPRLLIIKIVCENFKSYAGVKELGPFHKVQNYLWGVAGENGEPRK